METKICSSPFKSLETKVGSIAYKYYYLYVMWWCVFKPRI